MFGKLREIIKAFVRRVNENRCQAYIHDDGGWSSNHRCWGRTRPGGSYCPEHEIYDSDKLTFIR